MQNENVNFFALGDLMENNDKVTALLDHIEAEQKKERNKKQIKEKEIEGKTKIFLILSCVFMVLCMVVCVITLVYVQDFSKRLTAIENGKAILVEDETVERKIVIIPKGETRSVNSSVEVKIKEEKTTRKSPTKKVQATKQPTVTKKKETTTKQIKKININTADSEQLQELKGIGPVLAQKIIEYRQDIGGFTEIDQLNDIDGISYNVITDNRDILVVE